MRPGRPYIDRKVLDYYDDDPRDFGRQLDDTYDDPDEDCDEEPGPTDLEDEE